MSACEKKKREQQTTVNKEADNRECNGVDAKTVWKQNNKELLYSLVQAEAGNQDLDGCRLVTDVVINRINSDKFPNNLEDVIYAPGQFSVVKNGALKKAQGNVSAKVIKAVDMELSQGRLNTDILYFNNSNIGGFKYGDHWFR